MEIQGGLDSFAHSHNNQKQPAQSLTAEDTARLEKLQKRDLEVRRHEQAHINAANGLIKGGPKFEFETGPDGRQYAVEGSVEINTSKVEGDPEATIEKAKKIQTAALAPGNPSSQDRAVAATARRLEYEARKEYLEEKQNQISLYNQSGQSERISALQSQISFLI